MYGNIKNYKSKLFVNLCCWQVERFFAVPTCQHPYSSLNEQFLFDCMRSLDTSINKSFAQYGRTHVIPIERE